MPDQRRRCTVAAMWIPSWVGCMASSTGAVLPALFALGCGKRVPDDLKPVVDATMPVAIQIAENAAKICPTRKVEAPFQPNPMAAPPPPPSPAAGTSLASDAHVIDVMVMCSWPDPRDPKGETWAGTSLPRLKKTAGPPVRTVTMPDEIVENTCARDRHNCQQIIVPSRHHASESSADLRVVRPTPDGGEVEVIVAVVAK